MRSSTQAPKPESPYRGIHSFRYEDRELFFGREQAITELVAKTLLARLVLLFGESGSGKSSLINAGLIPALERENFCPVRIRVRPMTEDPIQIEWIPPGAELFNQKLQPDVARPDAMQDNRVENKTEQKTPLKLFLEDVYETDAYPVLIFDQFEELFTLFGNKGDNVQEQSKLQGDLLETIVQIVSNETLRAKVIIVIRDDYLAKLELLVKDFKLFGIFDYRVGLRNLHQVEAKQAILGPFEGDNPYQSCLIEELADRLITDLAQDQPGSYIRPTHLQIVCNRLWQRYAEEKAEITVADYKVMKEMKGILEGFLEDELAALEPTRRDVAYRILTHLVTESGTRDVVGREKLRGLVKQDEEVSDADFNAALTYLTEHRLVDGKYQRGNLYCEITSEYLIPAIERTKQQLALKSEREKARLERTKRERRLIGVVVLLLGLLAVVIILVWWRQRESRIAAQNRIDQANALAWEAISVLSEDPEHGLQLAADAALVTHEMDGRITYQTEKALRDALKATRVRLSLEGHRTGILETVYNVDGSELITAGSDGKVKIWDTASGQEEATTTIVGSDIRSAAISPDGKYLAVAGADGAVQIVEISSGKTSRILPATLRDQTLPIAVLDIAFGPQGDRLATGSADGKVRIWNRKTGALERSLDGHTATVNGVAFSPDGKQLLSGSSDRTAKLWDLTSGEVLHSLEGHVGQVGAVAFSPDGRVLVTTSSDRTARLWDGNTGNARKLLTSHDSTMDEVTFSPDSTRLATTGDDGSVRIWDIATGSELFKLIGHGDKVNAIAFSPDGKWLATASADATARVWDIVTADEEKVLPGGVAEIRGVVYGPEEMLYIAGTTGEVKILDLEETGIEQRTYVHGNIINDVILIPGENHLVSVGSAGIVRVWDLDTRQTVRMWYGHDKEIIWDIARSSDGKYLATAGDDGKARVWNVGSGGLERSFLGPGDALLTLTFSPDGKRLAAAGKDGQALVWNLRSGVREIALPDQKSNAIRSIAFSPDGEYLVTANEEGIASVWEVASGKLLRTLDEHTEQINSVSFTQEGDLVTGSADGTLRIWDIHEDEKPLLFTLNGSAGAIKTHVIIQDGKRLVSGGKDGMIRVYVLDPKELLDIAEQRIMDIAE